MTKKHSGLLATAAVVSALLVATGASASTTEVGTAKGAPSTSTQVRLVTGDIVSVTADASGRQTASVTPSQRQGVAGLFQTFNLGKDLYVVPQSAVPYLGRTLDLALFDVSRLVREPQSSLRVNVTLRAGAGTATLPGATMHRTGATTASATFTNASARVFGRALGAQWMKDHASPTHSTGLFASVARIGPARTAASCVPPKTDATRTITVKATDYNGNPDNGDSVNVYNVDDFSLCAVGVSFVNGQAQVTDAPDGHYSLLGFFFDFGTLKIYETAIPQFKVSKNTTVKIDARDATSHVTIATPKPADPTMLSVGVGRTDALGQTSSYTFLAGDPYQFYAAPTSNAPSVGQFHYFVYGRLFSTGAAKPYTYDVKYPNEGTIKADQSYVVKDSQLETIKTTYPADHDNQLSLDGRFAALPWETFLITSDVQFTAPLSRTEYYLARADVTWKAFDFSVYTPDPFTLNGEIDTGWEVYTPGDKHSESFRGQPTHPRLFERPLFINFTVCPVCLTPTKLDVLAYPFADNSPNHISFPDQGITESLSWSVKADGDVLQQGGSIFQASAARDDSADAYTLTYNMSRSSDDFLLSRDIKTTWKVKNSAPQSNLPAGWFCSLSGDTDCKVMAVITNSYDLPVGLLGRIASGDAEGGLSLGHLADASVKFKSVTLDVSYDGGTTWDPATVTDDGNGKYTVAFTVPKKAQTDGYGAIRLTAKDAKGGSLKQTIIRAFAVK